MTESEDALESISRLEGIKDQILSLLEKSSNLDASTRKIWGSDAKELYYQIVAAWQLLSRGRDSESAREILETARSRCGQTASELKTLGAAELEGRLRDAFAACERALRSYLPDQPPKAPEKRVLKSGEEYRLLCSVCGATAMTFNVGVFLFQDRESLNCSGITGSCPLPKDAAPQVFSLLDHGDLSALHSFVEESSILEEGLDAYCPECDAIYCRTHYGACDEWDEGFYDCTYGTCPNGHRRMIAD